MKSLLNNKWLQYYLPISISLFMLITIKRTVIVEDAGTDRLYGFPFQYISNNLGCTGCYQVCLDTLFLDLLFWIFLVFLLFKSFIYCGLKLKTHWGLTIFSLVVLVWWAFFFYMVTFDSQFVLTNDLTYKTTNKELVFFEFP